MLLEPKEGEGYLEYNKRLRDELEKGLIMAISNSKKREHSEIKARYARLWLTGSMPAELRIKSDAQRG